MKVNIDSIIYYGRFFASITDAKKQYWWFCLSDYTVYNECQLFSEYGYKSYDELNESKRFIPLFKTDIEKLEEHFLKSLTKTDIKAYNQIKQKSEIQDPDVIFKCFIDYQQLWKQWYNFERRALTQDAIRWCKEYGIAYQTI